MEAHIDSPFLVECISEWYHAQVVALHRLPSDSGKSIYQVKLTNGTLWVLRVVKDQGTVNVVALAQFFLFFEQHNYPAERIVLTVEQAPWVTVDGWHLMMTTFLVGTPLSSTPTAFLGLGAIVGRLHALTASLPSISPESSMLPSGELAFAQQQLDAIASLVPRPYRAQQEMLVQALASLGRGTHLPTTLIHGDCHPANALVTAPGQVTLLDWEEAGRGPAILDVGFLLVNCDGKAPWDPRLPGAFHPDAASLQAVVEGYGQFYHLTSDELDYLPDAIRFRSLVYGACRFAAAIAHQESAEFSEWWWNRYGAAEAIADQARTYFEHHVQEQDSAD